MQIYWLVIWPSCLFWPTPSKYFLRIHSLYKKYTWWIFWRYLENPAQGVKWHWLSLCFASGAVLSKETGIMSLAINVGYGLLGCIQQKYKYKTWKNTFKRLFWTDIFTVSLSFPMESKKPKCIPYSFWLYLLSVFWCKVQVCPNFLPKTTLLHLTRVF